MYESYFGFTSKPFQISPNPKFFYASPLHKKALSYLEYGLAQSEGFIVVTGPVGTGKSMLARSLLDELDPLKYVSANIVTSNLSPKELLEAIACEFGIECENTSKSYILREIEHFLIGLKRSGHRAIIIVDEAQNLPKDSLEELRMLSNYQLGSKPLVQSFLLGQEELRVKIQHPSLDQFKQRIIASCHLKPLTESETKSYIVHRLKHVGWLDTPGFSTQALNQVYSQTEGIPRRINVFMDRVLLYAFLEKSHLVDRKVITAVANELNEDISPDESSMPSTFSLKRPAHPSSSNGDIEDLINHLTELLEKSMIQKIDITLYIDFLTQKRKALRDQLELPTP